MGRKKKIRKWELGQIDGIIFKKDPLFDVLLLQECEIENLLRDEDFPFTRLFHSDGTHGWITPSELGWKKRKRWERKLDKLFWRRGSLGFYELIPLIEGEETYNFLRKPFEEYLEWVREKLESKRGRWFKLVDLLPLDESKLRKFMKGEYRQREGERR